MTQALSPLLDSLAYPSGSIEYTFFTSPTTATATLGDGEAGRGGSAAAAVAVASINSPADATQSAQFCLPHLLPLIPHHDAFLVACYSQHPLVGQLKTACADLTRAATKGAAGAGARKYVTGIFEASVLASLALLSQDDYLDGSEGEGEDEAFGIVSTGKIWETALQEAVEGFLGLDHARLTRRFAGVETTGLNATDLHDLPALEVREKMILATRRLLRKNDPPTSPSTTTNTDSPGGGEAVSKSRSPRRRRVKAICLGCAGMAGLDDAVRQACVEELGEELGKQVHVVDGVKAGVGVLVALARAAF